MRISFVNVLYARETLGLFSGYSRVTLGLLSGNSRVIERCDDCFLECFHHQRQSCRIPSPSLPSHHIGKSGRVLSDSIGRPVHTCGSWVAVVYLQEKGRPHRIGSYQ